MKKSNVAKLTAAIAMTLVSASMLSTASYAWFSMNKEVKATGMTQKTTAPATLLISNLGVDKWAASVEADENFGTNKLIPASSTNGLVFNAVAQGQLFGTAGQGGSSSQLYTDVVGAKVEMMATADVKALTDADDTDGYYAVYTYGLKSAANDSADALNVWLSSLTIENKTPVSVKLNGVTLDENGQVNGEGTVYYTNDTLTTVKTGEISTETVVYMKGSADLTKAVRVAMYIDDDATLVEETETNEAPALKGIYALSGATPKAIDSELEFEDTGVAPNVVHETLEDDSVIATTLTTIGAENKITYSTDINFAVSSKVVYVTLIVWVEGEDATCINVNGGAVFAIEAGWSVKDAE